jgi:hypothetical protein
LVGFFLFFFMIGPCGSAPCSCAAVETHASALLQQSKT